MPIRLECCSNTLDKKQADKNKALGTHDVQNPIPCYADTRPEFRMLGGSV